MPCQDNYASFDSINNNAAKVNELTEMLCSTCKAIGEKRIGILPQKVQKWWKEHKKEDAKRVAAEKKYRLEEVARLKERRREINAQLRKLAEYE